MGVFEDALKGQPLAVKEELPTLPVDETTPIDDIFQQALGEIDTPTEVAPEQTFTERIVGRGQERLEKLEGIESPFLTESQRQLRVAGQAIGFAEDIIGESVKSIFKNVLPESLQESIKANISNVLNTDIGQVAIGALKSGVETYQAFKADNPETAKDIESVMNVAAFIPVTKFGKPVIKESFDIVSDVTRLGTTPLKTTVKQLDNQILARVKNDIAKAIKPAMKGKTTFKLRERYFKNARKAVEEVISNKNKLKLADDAGDIVSGELPKNLRQFSEAISQTKDDIFNQFDTLARMAGEKSAVVDTKKVIFELENLANNGTLQRLNKNLAQYAQSLADNYRAFGELSPLDAQRDIKFLNEGLQAFYQNPSIDSSGKAFVDSLAANHLRKSLDKSIIKATNSRYQDLKNSYGALKAIETDVNKAFFREAKKGTKGLIDPANVLSSTLALEGILGANKSLTAAALGGRIVAGITAKFRDPDRLVRKMFQSVESLRNKSLDAGFNPKSKLGNAIKTRAIKSRQAKAVVPDEAAPKIDTKEFLTGNPKLDNELGVALSTPPFLRTAEQKLLVEMIQRR
jgi:hypothetical protein